ncbi:MAG: hypothetical protein GKR89_08995 [Candidatus Latescibacteria bacterium]|nr:hypothetical protein [Candidatus Latescibacterota bacterium]
MRTLALIAVATALLCGGPHSDCAWGQVPQIQVLETEQEQLAVLRHNLAGQRLRLVAEADSLAGLIGQLKAEAAESDELQEALRSSLTLVYRLANIDQQLEALQTKLAVVRDDLRLAYDWHIGRLIQELASRPDKALIRQLQVYQQARQDLEADHQPSYVQYGANMNIDPGDGPDEIHQKVGLMEDISSRLQIESQETAARLRRLEEERRLRARVEVFWSEINLFDEQLIEGRILVQTEVEVVSGPDEQTRIAEDMISAPAFEGDDVGMAPIESVVPPADNLVAGRGQNHGEEMGLDQLPDDDILVEIHKLKARQLEIRQLEAVVRERAESFRQQLQILLEGKR